MLPWLPQRVVCHLHIQFAIVLEFPLQEVGLCLSFPLLWAALDLPVWGSSEGAAFSQHELTLILYSLLWGSWPKSTTMEGEIQRQEVGQASPEALPIWAATWPLRDSGHQSFHGSLFHIWPMESWRALPEGSFWESNLVTCLCHPQKPSWAG